jgi:hypothetical protein
MSEREIATEGFDNVSVEDRVTAETIAAMKAYDERRTDAEVRAIIPERVRILQDGAQLTHGNRDKEYGPPALNLAAAGELKIVFRKHLRREISAAELEAIDQVLTKLGRVATGLDPKRDTYVDGATYFAIAGEIAMFRASSIRQGSPK